MENWKREHMYGLNLMLNKNTVFNFFSIVLRSRGWSQIGEQEVLIFQKVYAIHFSWLAMMVLSSVQQLTNNDSNSNTTISINLFLHLHTVTVIIGNIYSNKVVFFKLLWMAQKFLQTSCHNNWSLLVVGMYM